MYVPRACICARPRPGPQPGARAAGPARGPALKLSCLSLLPPRNPPAGRIPGPGAEMKIVSLGFSVKCQTGCPLGWAAPGEISHQPTVGALRLTSARSRKLAPGRAAGEVTIQINITLRRLEVTFV